MRGKQRFDVLVVYSSGMTQRVERGSSNRSPFSLIACEKDYEKAYAYLLDSISEYGLTVAFATSDDIIAAGTVAAYWTHDGNGWKAVRQAAFSEVFFDKLSPQTEIRKRQRELLFSSPIIVPFNDPELYTLFFDKLRLAEQLTTTTIPTVALESGDSQAIEVARNRLAILTELYSNRNDFACDYILKDRYGAAGNHVYRIAATNIDSIGKIISENPKKSFILQPMLLFDSGYQYKEWPGKTEIRLIFHNEKIVQTYLRIAETTLGLCNGHQGGNIIYQPIRSIPKKVRIAAERVIVLLPKHDSLYALDFVVSNEGSVYLLEGNTGPGLNWDRANLADVAGAKKLMRIIAKIMASKVEQTRQKKNILPKYLPVFAN